MLADFNGVIVTLMLLLRCFLRGSLVLESTLLEELKKGDFLMSNADYVRLIPNKSMKFTFFYVSLVINIVLFTYILIHLVFTMRTNLKTKSIIRIDTSATATTKLPTKPDAVSLVESVVESKYKIVFHTFSWLL